MRKPRLLGVALAAGLAVRGTESGAGVANWCITLDGVQETPPVSAPATGVGSLVYDTATNVLAYDIAYAGLGSPEIFAHIHGPAGRGFPAGVLFNLPLGTPKTGTLTVPELHEADLLAGLLYVNVHSTDFPNGEIRGQIDGPNAPCDLLFADGFEVS